MMKKAKVKIKLEVRFVVVNRQSRVELIRGKGLD
jgi:hypothetical protein